jgi:hypothetical protein
VIVLESLDTKTPTAREKGPQHITAQHTDEGPETSDKVPREHRKPNLIQTPVVVSVGGAAAAAAKPRGLSVDDVAWGGPKLSCDCVCGVWGGWPICLLHSVRSWDAHVRAARRT